MQVFGGDATTAPLAHLDQDRCSASDLAALTSVGARTTPGYRCNDRLRDACVSEGSTARGEAVRATTALKTHLATEVAGLGAVVPVVCLGAAGICVAGCPAGEQGEGVLGGGAGFG